MKLFNIAIALGVGATTAAGLSLLKVNKDVVFGRTAVVTWAGLMIALRGEDDLNKKGKIMNNFLIEHKINLKLLIMNEQYSITTKR